MSSSTTGSNAVPLSPELRLDIPFMPHIGVANAVDPRACKRLADELNRQAFEVHRLLGALDVVRYDEQVETIAQVTLG